MEYSVAGVVGSMLSLINELPNLVVCRTFSKAYGLAGLRMGYAVSQQKNIEALRNRHLGFELSTGWPPVVAASASLDDPDFLNMGIAKNEEGKSLLYEAYDKWGVRYNRSSTNFVYSRDDRFESNLLDKLRSRGILITKWPTMTDHIRVSIGKPDQIEKYIEVAEEYLV